MENAKFINTRRYEILNGLLRKMSYKYFGKKGQFFNDIILGLEGGLNYQNGNERHDDGPIRVGISRNSSGFDDSIEDAERFMNELQLALRIAKAVPYIGYYHNYWGRW